MRRWWNSLGFYWQVYLVMVVCFGCIIMVVEWVIEPMTEELLEELFALDPHSDFEEVVLWFVSIVVPTLAISFVLSHMVTRRANRMVALARRLSCGDLSARIATGGNERDVFDQLANVFNEMADSLERLLRHEKRLLADISHELRSPLTRMSVATALLPMKQEAGELESGMKILDDEIDQMNRLVAVLLEQGRERLNNRDGYSRIDLSELVSDAVDIHVPVAESARKGIDSRVAPGLAVWGHDLRLRRIFDNILSNALFYAPVDSWVEVRAWRNDECVFFSVRDYGPGVPEAHLRDIFRAFFRVDRSRARKSGGAGLGLALAREAAVAMGGDIEAHNAAPGLEVVVTLPRAGRERGPSAAPK